MAGTNDSSEGTVVWVDLGSTDIEGSKEFYRRLFGWSYDEFVSDEGSYFTALLDSGPVGGMMALSEEQLDSGTPSVWGVFFGSADLDRDVERVAEFGGTVIREPFEIPGGDRLAVVSDPTGARFALATFSAVGAGRLRWDEAGSVCWVECQTCDVEASVAFFERLFGWTTGGTDQYLVFERDGEPIAGLMAVPPGVPDEVPSYWFAYWRVEDLDRTVGSATDGGGTAVMEPMTVEDGRFTVIEDPTGGVIGVFEPTVAS